MLNKYVKRHRLTKYENISWSWLTCFEQVVTDGIAKYYIIDYGDSRIVTFNDYWEHQNNQNLPHSGTFTIKYVSEYFYFSSNSYFYKTDSNFSVIDSYQMTNALYRQFIFDSNSSKFYLPSYKFNQIDIFNTSCSLLQSIVLSIQPYSLSHYNGALYAGDYSSNKIVVIHNDTVTNYFEVTECTKFMSGISVDSFGHFAVTCSDNQLITIYDSNGNYMNTQISTYSQYPRVTSIDSNGRYVIISEKWLDIYY